MREKLIELIEQAKYCSAEELADYLIEAGLILPSETMPSNPYWGNICNIAEKQRAKGIATYGQGIELNQADITTRIEYYQEELIDALMYCEWIKDSIQKVSGEIDFAKISPFEVGNTIRISLPKDKKIMTYNGEEIEFDYEAED